MRVIRQATFDAAFLENLNRVRPQAQLDAIAWKLNTRPRKSMGFQCPAELFIPDAFDCKKHHASLVCTWLLKPAPPSVYKCGSYFCDAALARRRHSNAGHANRKNAVLASNPRTPDHQEKDSQSE